MSNPFEQDNVWFDESSHTYFDKETGKTFISPTTLIKKYCNIFDENGKILERCAARDGVSSAELKATWEKIGEDARDRGHLIHNSFEQYIKTGQIQKDGNEDIIEDFKQNIQPSLEGKLYPEVTLSSKNLGVAGRTDLVHHYWENILDIIDIKTNARKKISKFSWGKNMFYPLNHLPDANYFQYECQLSLYSLLLEEQGFCIRNLNLLWINKKRKIEVIPVQYRKNDVVKLLKHYNENKE